MCFMEEDEAVKTMSLFEGAAENRRISKSSLKNWVVSFMCLVLLDSEPNPVRFGFSYFGCLTYQLGIPK